MARHDDEYDFDGQPYVVIERRDAGIGPLLLGMALGAGAALLFAPRSGPETRRLIGSRARDARDAARRRVEELSDNVASAVGDVRERVGERVDAVREAVRTQRDDIVDAFEAGRAAAHEARAELERRIAENKQARRRAGA